MTITDITPPLFDVTVELIGKGAYKICWKTKHQDLPVSIFLGRQPSTIDRSKPVARTTDRTWVDITGLDPDIRPYFEVIPDSGPHLITAYRKIPLENTYNFRDLGGYENNDGRRVKWGLVFRSDALSRLKENDQAYLERMGLKLVCDLRSEAEAEKAPDKLPANGSIDYIHFPIQTGELNFVSAMEKLKKGDDSWLTEGYMVRGYIRNIEEFAGVWAAVLERATEAKSRPLVFHCTGGKDRAGTCAAFLLLALGVPEETVIYDHQLTNVYISSLLTEIYAKLESMGLDPDKLRPYFTAPKACIEALLSHLKEHYQTIENYLITKAGLNPAILDRLKQELLE